jgi:hypothetical protein
LKVRRGSLTGPGRIVAAALPVDLVEQIALLAMGRGASWSDVIRQALTGYMEPFSLGFLEKFVGDRLEAEWRSREQTYHGVRSWDRERARANFLKNARAHLHSVPDISKESASRILNNLEKAIGEDSAALSE